MPYGRNFQLALQCCTKAKNREKKLPKNHEGVPKADKSYQSVDVLVLIQAF